MVIAYHLIWTLYGWWLPNDPRGSTSQFVHSDVIFDLGNLHEGRKRIQPSSREIREFYNVAKNKLRFPLLSFAPTEFSSVAAGFAIAIKQYGYTCYACAIMPDHIHILIRKHKHLAEEMIENLQSASRDHLIKNGIRGQDHPIWGGPGWKVYLDTPEDIWRTKKYIEDNPLPFRLPRQTWSFITPYDNWPRRKPIR
jgi:REP element-mobilizing transposase RayT